MTSKIPDLDPEDDWDFNVPDREEEQPSSISANSNNKKQHKGSKQNQKLAKEPSNEASKKIAEETKKYMRNKMNLPIKVREELV
jgi:hypothetical protein